MNRLVAALCCVIATLCISVPAYATHWQTPSGYSRSPTGSTPTNPITMSVSFDDQSGCPSQVYSFWVFDGSGNPQYQAGAGVTLQNGAVTQNVSFTASVNVPSVRLACLYNITNGWGSRYDSSGSLGESGFTPQDSPAVHWQSPENYTRTPGGSSPERTVTFSAEFEDETGCATGYYSFWVYRSDDVPIYKVGEEVSLVDGVVEQTALLPNDIGIDIIKLVCVTEVGGIDEVSDPLESGTPAFRPYETPTSAVWSDPANYARWPQGLYPALPILFFVEFDDETDCPNQTYRFWVYDDEQNPIYGMGQNTSMQDGILYDIVILPDGIPIAEVRLACTNANGTLYDASVALESGSPAFTPITGLEPVTWDAPEDYTRFPSGDNIPNPVLFTAYFNDETGCATGTYSFWLHESDGTPIAKVGEDVTLINGHVEQEVWLPDSVPVEAIRLACTDVNGDLADVSGNLESGTPAFTPYDAPYNADWQHPEGYIRTPSGATPLNPVTFRAYFDDENGCPNGTYSFWKYAANGTPLTKLGEDVTMSFGYVEQEVTLEDGVDVDQIRLVCTDENGDYYDASVWLENGTPAFTPTDIPFTNWSDPFLYLRSPSVILPSNPITLSALFTDETGCASQLYAFWVYDSEGNPVEKFAEEVALSDNVVTQTGSLDTNVPVEAIRLACVDGNGDIDDVTAADLESGSPAFIPLPTPSSADWQHAVNYRRYPQGSTPTNPIIFSAEFNDETGCPTHTYNFWKFNAQNQPVAKVGGTDVTVANGRLIQVVSLPDGVGIDQIRLACTDENGDRYDSGGALESGSPIFTPQDP
jgi:hypothetical protein